jgi:tetratricopeptide (TPR) repeat protein
MAISRPFSLLGLLVGVLASVASAQQEEEPTAVARAALRMCRSVSTMAAEERLARLDEGLALAEAAMQADPSSALAHFAAFCNRGKRLQMTGFSFGAFGEVRRLRREIDRALALAPDWPEALAGKGAMLVALPRLLGGDVEEGERLLKRALTLDPTNVEARIILRELENDACAAGPMIAQVGFLQ